MAVPSVRFRKLAVIVVLLAGGAPLLPQRAAAQEKPATKAPTSADEDLAQVEARLAERYDRLELLVGRLAELSRSTQPRRATLLRQLIAQSRDRDVAGQFYKVVAALEQESYSSAIDGQAALEVELQKLLELLLQEDRDRQIESERKRIARYLQDLNRLIRLQRGVKARTDGGDEEAELAKDQQNVGDKTKELGDEIEEAEGTAEAKAQRDAVAKSAEGKPKEGDESSSDQKPSKNNGGQPKDGGDQPSPDKPGKGAQPPSESQPSEGRQGEPKEGPPGQGQGSPSGEQGDQPPEPSEQQDAGSPMERAAQRLRRAQQRMDDAKKQLEEAKRQGAVKEQQQAVEELEQAKAELERILRQLREEELERMLVMLEARFRKMLDEQTEIYEETKRLDAAMSKAPAHELEIASGRLARKEGLIVREAERALVLLREDGTSVAFPEAVEQARDDMQSIAQRLRETKVDLITQHLEEDVIAALEETLAAMQQALKKLREQRGQQQQGGGGEPGEKPLVDLLAELRMIRALQVRVNRRTQQYGAMIDGEQAQEVELLKALDELGLRQQKIFQATRDLERQEN